MVVSKKNNKYPVFRTLQYLVLFSAILYFGKTLFIPLSFSILISFILYPVCHWLEKNKLNRGPAIFISISAIFLVMTILIALLVQQVMTFSAEWPGLKNKLILTYHDFSLFLINTWNISGESQKEWLDEQFKKATAGSLPFLKDTLYSLGVWLVLAVLIPLFSGLILYYRKALVKLVSSFFEVESENVVREILHQSVHTYYNFIKGMALVYLIVGLLNSLGLWALGIPHPFLFGFIASILTFIPYVGIIIASLLPISISWLTYNSIWYPIGVIAVFTLVQYLEANIIFPFAVSNRLKINTLVTLLAIITGGILWGAAGMILFVPMVAIFKLIADHTPSMKSVSEFLNTK